MDSKGYIALNDFDFESAEKNDRTIARFATRKLYDKKTLGEEMRLLYVALTRAKRYMYVTSSISNEKLKTFGKIKGISAPGSMLDIIDDAICNGANISYSLHRNELLDDISQKKQTYVFPAANPELVGKIEEMQSFVYPHEKATKLAIKYSVSALDSLDEQTVSAYTDGDFKDVGTIYHKIMQHIDFATSGVKEVEQEIARLVEEKAITQEEVDMAREADGDEFLKKIARCLDGDIIRKAYEWEKQGRCVREKAFMMYKPAREVRSDFDADEKVLVQGVIDLFIDGDEKIIVDFKNSLLKNENSLEKYEKQLNLYRIAVESAISAKVDKLLLYSFKTGEIKNVRII